MNRRRIANAGVSLALLWSLLGALLAASPEGLALAQDATQIEPRGANGAVPEGLTAELTVGDVRFLFDRMVPAKRTDMTRVGQAGRVIVYARTDQGPFDAVYVSIPPRSDAVLARYLPERNDQPDSPCPA